MAGLTTQLLALGAEIFDLLSGPSNDWAVFFVQSTSLVIQPDTVASFEFRGDSRISDYPIEKGAFASYNKVQTPNEIRMRMVCDGSSVMGRGDFIAQLAIMKASTDLYDIATPDTLYQSFNLVHFDFRRETRNGLKLITADTVFEEVRETATAVYATSKEPSGSLPEDTGSAQTFAYGAMPAKIGVFQ